MRKLVYGVGVNDIAGGGGASCPFYCKWKDMLARCYSQKYQAAKPTYIGCKVCEEWLTFSNFKAWMETQDWQGKQLDKDLNGDSKLYSPATCVFVSRVVNMFTVDRGAKRGEYPIGVCLDKRRGKYRAQVNANGRLKTVGRYNTPSEAHNAWRIVKQELAIKLIESQSDFRVGLGLWSYALSLNRVA